MNKKIKITKSKHKDLIGQEFNVLEEYRNAVHQIVYRLDTENPAYSKMKVPLWVNSEDVEIVRD